MIKASVLIELTDNHITALWAKANDQEFARVHLTPADNEEWIKMIIKVVNKSKEVLKPRRTEIEKS